MIIEQREAPEPSAEASPTPRERTSARWRWRLLIALAIALYNLLWVITAFDKLNPTDLDVFFLPAVRIALNGHPLEVYTLRVGLIYPNANGPLGLLPLTLAAWIARARGWLDDPMLRRALVFVITTPFPLLVGWEAGRAVDRFGPTLRGMARWLVYLPILLTPLLWLSALYYGHTEQAIVVWLGLASTRLLAERRYVWGGALLGLAFLTRSDASMLVLALALTLLVWRRWRGTLLTLLAAGATLLLGLAPFLLADSHDVIFSLFTFRSALPVGGGDLWSASGASTVIAIAQRFDALVALTVAALLILIAHVARSDLDLDSPDIYGLLALASFCFALLIKTLWPYYYLESALFATVWALAAMPHRGGEQPHVSARTWTAWAALWLPALAISASAIIAEAGLESSDYHGWVDPWPHVNIVCQLITVALLLVTLFGARWARRMAAHRETVERGILSENAPEAAIEG